MTSTDDSKTKKSRENSVTLIAAGIGLLSAIITAIVPFLLDKRDPAPQSAAYAQATTPTPSQFNLPDLTLGVWQIVNSVDDGGTNWNGSTLKFTAQAPTPQGAHLEGFFEWRNGGTVIGREFIMAKLDGRTNQLYIEGQYTEAVTHALATGTFSAELSDDGRQLLHGTWGNTPGRIAAVPGKWEARR